MVLKLQDKQNIIAKVSEVAKSALSAVVANSCGISVDKMTELRKKGRELGIYLRIVRNTLMRRIIKDTSYECLKEIFIGPTLIAFSNKHPGAAAKLFQEFIKINPKFKIKAAAFEGKFIPADKIDELATIPTYEEAIIRLALTMKEASINKLVRVLIKIRDQKKL